MRHAKSEKIRLTEDVKILSFFSKVNVSSIQDKTLNKLGCIIFHVARDWNFQKY